MSRQQASGPGSTSLPGPYSPLRVKCLATKDIHVHVQITSVITGTSERTAHPAVTSRDGNGSVEVERTSRWIVDRHGKLQLDVELWVTSPANAEELPRHFLVEVELQTARKNLRI